jgi:hypothetical protein
VPEGDAAAWARDARALGEVLLAGYTAVSRGLVELHAGGPRFTADASDRPLASPLARWQARAGGVVVNQRHEQIVLTPLERRVLGLLDGRHDRPSLQAALGTLVEEGAPPGQAEGEEPRGGGCDGPSEEALERQLSRFARIALLIA